MKKTGHCVSAHLCVCIFMRALFFMHVQTNVLLDGRLEGLRTSSNKQTLCVV